MLNISGESGHPRLIPDMKGNVFNFSPLRIMIAIGLSHIGFIIYGLFKYWSMFLVSLLPGEFSSFEWVLKFVEIFLCVY